MWRLKIFLEGGRVWMTKKVLFLGLLLFALCLAPSVSANQIFYDNFNDGTITDWHIISGGWTAASQYLSVSGTFSATIDHNVGADFNVINTNQLVQINYRHYNTGGTNGEFFWMGDQNTFNPDSGPGNGQNGYSMSWGSSDQGAVARWTNGTRTTILGGLGTLSAGSFHDINIMHSFDGNITVFADGVFKGTVFDTTYNTGKNILFSIGNGTNEQRFDDINITGRIIAAPIGDANAFFTIAYSNYGTDSNMVNYTNALNYDIDYKCLIGRTGLIRRYTNNVNDLNYVLNCNSVSNPISGTYTPPSSGFLIDSKFSIQDLNFGSQFFSPDQNFIGDINAPIADLNYSASTSSFTMGGGVVQLNLTCFDQTSSQVDYNITDSTSFLNGRFPKNSMQSTNVNVLSSTELFNGRCIDLAGNIGTDFNIVTAQINCFRLVDETLGTALTSGDINALGGMTATSYLTHATYNFKTTNNPNICFTGSGGDTIRFDINYSDGTQIFREFNQNILQNYDANVNVCVADLQSFFEQDFTSSRNTPIVLRHQLSQCFNTADYTKYAEGDALSLRAFTIIGPYYMDTFDSNGNKIVLAQINGGTPSGIQVDVLKFKTEQVPVQIVNDYLGVNLLLLNGATDSNTLKFYYTNIKNDNARLQVSITDDSGVIFTYDELNSPNNFVFYFDHTLVPIDGNFLTVTLTKTKTDTTVETETKVISLQGIIQGAKGVFGDESQGIAAIFAIVIFLFGFTMVSAKYALGWVGILVTIISLVVLTLSSQAWYIIWLQAVLLIIAIYLAIAYKDQHAAVT